jgi:hypothetical protein
MLGNDLAGGILAAAAATADGELALHFEQRARAVVDGFANLAVTYRVADAYIHVGPLINSGTQSGSLGTDSNCE